MKEETTDSETGVSSLSHRLNQFVRNMNSVVSFPNRYNVWGKRRGKSSRENNRLMQHKETTMTHIKQSTSEFTVIMSHDVTNRLDYLFSPLDGIHAIGELHDQLPRVHQPERRSWWNRKNRVRLYYGRFSWYPAFFAYVQMGTALHVLDAWEGDDERDGFDCMLGITDQAIQQVFLPLGFNEERETMSTGSSENQKEQPQQHCPFVADLVQRAFQEIWYGGARHPDTVIICGGREAEDDPGLSFEIEIRVRRHRLNGMSDSSQEPQSQDSTTSLAEER